jgi:hypothetical protein
MTMHLGAVPAGTTLYIPFATYAGATGASITLTGLAVTDIEIYKNGSVTQRSSDAGYALLDTDGIDFDGITGIHGFSIDLSDNTDAGFYSVGAFYWVVVSAVTVDSQTVNFIAATFRIAPAEGIAGYPKVDVHAFAGTAATVASGRPEVNTSHIAGAAVSTTTAQIGVNVVQVSGDATAADNLEAAADGTGYNLGGGQVVAASVTAGVTVTTNNDKTGYALTVAPLDAAGTRAAVGLASANLDTQLATIAGYIDTEVAAILAAVDTEVAAIKADTAAILIDTNELQTDNVPGLIAALNDISPAEVNAEVVDALTVDTYAELASVPAATSSLKDKLTWLFMLARNRTTQISTTLTLRNDGNSADVATATTSDDGTTTVRGKYI